MAKERKVKTIMIKLISLCIALVVSYIYEI